MLLQINESSQHRTYKQHEKTTQKLNNQLFLVTQEWRGEKNREPLEVLTRWLHKEWTPAENWSVDWFRFHDGERFLSKNPQSHFTHLTSTNNSLSPSGKSRHYLPLKRSFESSSILQVETVKLNAVRKEIIGQLLVGSQDVYVYSKFLDMYLGKILNWWCGWNSKAIRCSLNIQLSL